MTRDLRPTGLLSLSAGRPPIITIIIIIIIILSIIIIIININLTTTTTTTTNDNKTNDNDNDNDNDNNDNDKHIIMIIAVRRLGHLWRAGAAAAPDGESHRPPDTRNGGYDQGEPLV